MSLVNLMSSSINHEHLKKQMYYCYVTASVILPGGNGTTVRHNIQITHITQNNTLHTKHKTTQTIKDTPHTLNTMQICA
jgi:hypothetical protein